MAGNYGAPWQALLNDTPTPVDTVRDPMFDQLMGFSEDPNDSGITSLIKGFQSGMARNTPQGQALTMEIAKQRLANQMQMQLMQQKIELAKQYPEYKVVNTPYGANLVNPYDPNDVHSIEAAPGAKDAYAAQLAASTAENQFKASPEGMGLLKQQEQGKVDLQKAQVGYYNTRPDLVAAQIDAAKAKAQLEANGGVKAMQGMAYKDAVARAVADLTGVAGTDSMSSLMASTKLQKMMQADPSIRDQFQQRVQQYMQPKTSGLGGSPQQQQPNTTGIPDLSNLMNPSTLGQ